MNILQSAYYYSYFIYIKYWGSDFQKDHLERIYNEVDYQRTYGEDINDPDQDDYIIYEGEL